MEAIELRRAACRKWREANPEAAIASGRRWRAENPEAAKEASRRHNRENREARNAACRSYYAEHKERQAARHREWCRANPDRANDRGARRRARIANSPVNDFTAKQWVEMKAAYGGRCAYCGNRRPLERDHVVPLSKGGPHTASNIVPACKSCNSRKGAR